MKKIKLLISGLLLFFAGTMQSQVVVTATIGNPPPWGPGRCSRSKVYYIPDIQAYYDITDATSYIYICRW